MSPLSYAIGFGIFSYESMENKDVHQELKGVTARWVECKLGAEATVERTMDLSHAPNSFSPSINISYISRRPPNRMETAGLAKRKPGDAFNEVELRYKCVICAYIYTPPACIIINPSRNGLELQQKYTEGTRIHTR